MLLHGSRLVGGSGGGAAESHAEGGLPGRGDLVTFMFYQQSLSGAFNTIGWIFTGLAGALGAADKPMAVSIGRGCKRTAGIGGTRRWFCEKGPLPPPRKPAITTPSRATGTERRSKLGAPAWSPASLPVSIRYNNLASDVVARSLRGLNRGKGGSRRTTPSSSTTT